MCNIGIKNLNIRKKSNLLFNDFLHIVINKIPVFVAKICNSIQKVLHFSINREESEV